MDLNQVWQTYCAQFEDVVLPKWSSLARVQRLVASWDASMPNVLLYGAPHTPFYPIWHYIVLRPLGKRAADLHYRTCMWPASGGVPYLETDAFLYFDMQHPDMPKDAGEQLEEFLKTVLPFRCMHLHKHIVVIENVDVLCEASPQSMRVLFERFSANVWFVATTTRLNAIEAPLQSRFLTVRIPWPTEAELSDIVHTLYGYRCSARRSVVDALLEVAGEREAATSVPLPPTGLPKTANEVRNVAQKVLQSNVQPAAFARALLPRVGADKRPALLQRLCAIEAQSCRRKKGRDIFYYEAMLLAAISA